MIKLAEHGVNVIKVQFTLLILGPPYGRHMGVLWISTIL